MAKAKKKVVELSNKSKALVELFSASAQSWGWEQDQGVGKAVDRAEKQFKKSKADLEKRILFLEKQNKNLRKKLKENSVK